MENYIKEEKHGFFLDKTDSSGFRENQARRIGRAKGVETYFAFNPFCEKKTKNWHNGVAFPPVSSPTLDNRKRTIPKYDFHRRLKKSFLFY